MIILNLELKIEAIFYERYTEIIHTGPGGHYFDRRRKGARESIDALTSLGGLQLGTPAHLPVPAAELEVLGLATYNYGGDDDPTGLTMTPNFCIGGIRESARPDDVGAVPELGRLPLLSRDQQGGQLFQGCQRTWRHAAHH